MPTNKEKRKQLCTTVLVEMAADFEALCALEERDVAYRLRKLIEKDLEENKDKLPKKEG